MWMSNQMNHIQRSVHFALLWSLGGVLLVCLLVCAPLRAVAQDEEGSTLASLLKGLHEKSPQLISAAAEAQRYQTRVPLIEKLSDPFLAFYYLDFPVGNISSGWASKESEEKAGPAIKAVGRRGRGSILTGLDMAEDTALWYQYLYEDKILLVSSQIRQNYYRIYFLDEIIAVSEQSLAALDGLIRTSSASYAVGKVRQKDVLRVQVERYQLQAELLRLRQERLERTHLLNYLCGRPTEQELLPRLSRKLSSDNLPTLRYPVISLISGLYTHKPLIKGYQALGGRFKAMRSMVQMYFTREVQTEAMFEADSGFRAMKAKGKDYYNSLVTDLQTTVANLEKNRELARLYGKVIVPQGRQTFNAGLADFQVGKEDYSIVLTALIELNRDQVRYYQSLSDYMADLARLEGLSGIHLNDDI